MFLQTIEDSSFSTWLRESESPFGFYFVLLFHTFGLALLVGANSVVDLRLLGFFPKHTSRSAQTVFPHHVDRLRDQCHDRRLAAHSHTPPKPSRIPVFYTKLTMIGFAIWILTKLQKQVFAGTTVTDADMMARGATLAKWSLFLWLGAISAGRLLAYTYRYITFPF